MCGSKEADKLRIRHCRRRSGERRAEGDHDDGLDSSNAGLPEVDPEVARDIGSVSRTWIQPGRIQQWRQWVAVDQ